MKRIFVVFGSHLPDNKITEKADKVRQEILKEGLEDLQTTTYVSDLSRCWKHADQVSDLLYGNRHHRVDGLVKSKIYPPKLLAETVHKEVNQHQITILIVNYVLQKELKELLKGLGAEKFIFNLVPSISLEKDVVYFNQKDMSLVKL